MTKAWRILAAVMLLAGAYTTAAAQEDGPNMLVTAGFGGYCRHNRWCPVRVTLSNEGADIEGFLRIDVPASGSAADQPDVYAQDVVLPSHSRKAYFLYAPPPSPPPLWAPYSLSGIDTSRLEVLLTAGQLSLASEAVSLRIVQDRDRLYGVVSSQPSSLNFLNDVGPTGAQAFVARLSLDALPPDPLGWEALDVLVLNDVDTTALTPAQRRALETWISGGGHLIVGGGGGASQTTVGVAGLLPVAVGGLRTMHSLHALGEGLDALVTTGPFLVAESTLRQGEILIQQEGFILVARQRVGAGVVDFVAFDAGLNPFARWEHVVDLWEFIVDTGGTSGQRLAIRDRYSAERAAGAIPGLKPPSALQIVAFLLTYVLLVGPVNYLVLRKLDRRELAWFTVPALIVGFTASAYWAGVQIRGRQATVHRLATVYVPQGATTGYATELVGLFSPRRTSYDVRVSDAGLRALPREEWAVAETASIRVAQQPGVSTLTDLWVDVGALRSFLAEGYAETVPPQASLQLLIGAGGTRVSGTVQNGSLPLENAVLLTALNEQRLGDLQPGQTVLADVQIASIPPVEDLAGRIMGPLGYPEDREQYRRHQFLQSVFPVGGPELEPGVYLVGWTDRAPLDLEVVGERYSSAEVALYVFELPTAGVESGTTIRVTPTPASVEETTGYADVGADGIYLSESSSAVIQFTVWPDIALSQVQELTLDLQPTPWSTGPLPKLALWNWQVEAWDLQDVEWGTNSVPDPAQYVDARGTVRLRLETDEDQDVAMEMLTISIAGQG